MNKMKARVRCALLLLLFTLSASFAFSGVIYDRSLDPKSLITWTPTGTYIIGDDMGFAGFSAGDTITKVTIWVVADNTGTTKLSTEVQSMSLFLGLDAGAATSVSNQKTLAGAQIDAASTLIGTFANPTLGKNQPIFRVVFDGLSFSYAANSTVDFAVQGITTGGPFNLASILTPTLGQNCPGGPTNKDAAPGSCDNVFITFSTIPNFPSGPYSVINKGGSPATFGPGDPNILVESAGIVNPLLPTITKAFGAANLQVGNSTTLSFTLTNPTGNPTSFTNLTFTDNLPAGLVISTPNGLAGTCGGGTITATAATSLIKLTGATLTAGASCTFSVNVTGVTPGVQQNTTSTLTDNEGVTGAAATANITVVNAPTISKAFANTTLDLFGPSTTLSFTIGNPNLTTLTGIAFFDTLPAGIKLATPDSGLVTTCTGGGTTVSAPAGGSTITLSGLTLTSVLTPVSTCTISVQVVGAQLGTFTNTTSPITAFGGTVVGNTASATISVQDLYFLWFFLEGGGGSKGAP
jgi:hypothetical protein